MIPSAQEENAANRSLSRKKKSLAAALGNNGLSPRSSQFGDQQRFNVPGQDALHDQFRPENDRWRAHQIVREGYKLKIVIEMTDQAAVKCATPRPRTALPVRTDTTQILTTFAEVLYALVQRGLFDLYEFVSPKVVDQIVSKIVDKMAPPQPPVSPPSE